MSRIGFIGFGEVSSNIILGLLAEKEENFVIYDTDIVRARNLIKSLTISNKIRIATTLHEFLLLSDTVFVAIPGRYDEDLFNEIIKEKPSNNLFIDLCTTSPSVKISIEAEMINLGCHYVDVAVMGSVLNLKQKVPMYISGCGSEKMLQVLSDYSTDITIVGDKAGEASTIKLCRSIYMKALAAISIEMSAVSKYYGVEDKVYKSLSDSLDKDTFINYTNRLINGTIKHCQRRLHEMTECLDIIKAAGISGDMTQATISLYQKLLK